MYAVEFFADKIPGVDTGWDSIHTFIRIPAGAALAAAAVGDVNPAVALAAALVGGSLTTATHAGKSGSRLLINTSPEPVSNWGASIGEDLAVVGGMWVALTHPVIFLLALIIFIALLIWLLPKIWYLIKRIFSNIRRLFRREDTSLPPEPPLRDIPARRLETTQIIDAEIVEETKHDDG
jgi:CBS domain containing-hemolysin-like protein